MPNPSEETREPLSAEELRFVLDSIETARLDFSTPTQVYRLAREVEQSRREIARLKSGEHRCSCGRLLGKPQCCVCDNDE